MTSTNKPFFYFESLKDWEKWMIGIYLLISFCLGVWYINEDAIGQINILMMYGISSQLFIIMFLYTSLRNLTSYFIWCLIGLIHLGIYFILKDYQPIQIKNNHPALCLVNTIIILAFFQFFRFLSIIFQKQEYIVPGRGMAMFGNTRKATFMDYFASFGLFLITDTLWFITLKKG